MGYRILRIILTLPAAILGWYSAVITRVMVELIRVYLFCPDDTGRGAECYASGWESYPYWLVCSAIALSAIFSISLVALVAPDKKYDYSLGYYIFGSILALVLAVTLQMYLAGFSALCFGALTVFVVKRLTKQGNNAK